MIQLSFAPGATVAGFEVRLETIALAASILVALLLAALIARRTPAEPADTVEPAEHVRLRPDELLVLAFCAIPGAIAGGRLGYGLVHADVFGANSGALLDPARAGLELPLAVAGGAITASIAAAVLDAPIRRWLQVATLPVLVAIGGGKLAMALGGAGQGLPFDGAWATAYLGDGPWATIAPAIPSHPAQLYEAGVVAAVILVIGGALAVGAFRSRRGTIFGLGMAAWLLGRAAVATTWRDPAVLGPLRADQAISIVLAVLVLALTTVDAALGRYADRPE